MSEEPRRGHAAFARSLPEDHPRETIRVDYLPDPPATPGTVVAGTTSVNREEMIVNVIREEMDELAVRLDRFGVQLTVAGREQLVDTTFAILGGYGGGGAIPGRT